MLSCFTYMKVIEKVSLEVEYLGHNRYMFSIFLVLAELLSQVTTTIAPSQAVCEKVPGSLSFSLFFF